MKIKQLKTISFSPTGTTQKILEGIAKGISDNVEYINLTLQNKYQKNIQLLFDDLVILGAPVYGGRLPIDAVNRFKQLRANNTPVILLVVYGNRDFGDALLELKNLAVSLGFIPIAGCAFVGEHSFATSEVHIANGRPDSLDLQKAMEFGKEINEKLKFSSEIGPQINLEIPGIFPYENEAFRMAVSPATKEESCNICGKCVKVCPTGAISINDSVVTEVEQCILCSACIKNCPTDSRFWKDEKIMNIAIWLKENCIIRQEPQLFEL